jgi:hypothetical protein
MSLLARLAPWTTTGVGSLPHTDAAQAAAHVVAAYELPFCPQLPALDGDMVTEWLGADPRRCGWAPDRDRERPRAWDHWLAELQRTPPAHGVVKLQVTGPATLACALERLENRRPSRRDSLALAGELAAWLAANVAAQVATLRERGLDALLIVDEPALAVYGTTGVEATWEPLRAVAPAWGLHLCCPVDWALIDRAAPDVLSFDLALSPVDDTAAAALERLLHRGGRVMWGVVQPPHPEHGADGSARLDAARRRLHVPGEQSLVSPACGSGRMSLHREAELATAVADVARAMRSARTGATAG